MLKNLTIKLASQLLSAKKISSLELTKFYLDRIKKFDPAIQAFITVDEAFSLAQAKKSDHRRLANKRLSQWDGIPVAIKDVLVTKDFRTTAGSKMLVDFEPPYDATVIKKMCQAGLVFLGKTNMDEFAMGSSTENSAYQITKNPWDERRVPGGSSGGSAAAVSADMCTAALGSDTGGSIRQPASLCGIVGLKPTYGAVSRYGLIAMSSSLDQVGPMTKTVEDAKIMYDIISGDDTNDPTSQTANIRKEQQKICRKFANGKFDCLKIGIPKEFFRSGLDKKVQNLIVDATKRLQQIGGRLVDISLPKVQYGLSAYYIIMPVEVASNLARFDGIRFGLKPTKSKSYIEDIKNIRSHGFGPEVKRRIIFGTFASSAGYAEKYYLQAQKVRALVKQDFDKAFNRVDLIAGPVSPTTAFKIGEKVNDPLSMYLSDIFTIPVNLAGLPAISLPCGLANGLPVGLYLIARQFQEQLLFDVGVAFQKETDYQFTSPLVS